MTQLKSMQRIFMFLYSLFACMLIMNPLVAIALQDKQDVKNDLRILELLPNLLCPLAVDPGIPADFVALSPNGILDLHDLIYWGPKDALKVSGKSSHIESINSNAYSFLLIKNWRRRCAAILAKSFGKTESKSV